MTMGPGSFANVNQFGTRNCNNDYLVIPGGFAQDFLTTTSTQFDFENPNFGDRFCGEQLSASSAPGVVEIGQSIIPMTPTKEATKQTICSKWKKYIFFYNCVYLLFHTFIHRFIQAEVKPFTLYYRTNEDEATTFTQDTNAANIADKKGRGNRGFCLSFTQS